MSLACMVPFERTGERFVDVLLVGDLSSEALGEGMPAPRRLPLPEGLTDAQGRLPVAELVRLGAGGRRRPGLLLVLADRDLAMPGCRSLRGFADRGAGVAVVSTARLQDALAPDRLAARLRNEAIHELGHLNGLGHCGDPACVMKPARTVRELDDRPERFCGRCPKLSATPGRAAAAAAFALLALLALVVGWGAGLLAGPEFHVPFT